jgi:hypothetical protein
VMLLELKSVEDENKKKSGVKGPMHQ